MNAAYNGHVNVVRALVENTADVHITDKVRSAAVHVTVNRFSIVAMPYAHTVKMVLCL